MNVETSTLTAGTVEVWKNGATARTVYDKLKWQNEVCQLDPEPIFQFTSCAFYENDNSRDCSASDQINLDEHSYAQDPAVIACNGGRFKGYLTDADLNEFTVS